MNSISERVAMEMARGVRLLFRSSIAMATTGYAEPAPDDAARTTMMSSVEVPNFFISVTQRSTLPTSL